MVVDLLSRGNRSVKYLALAGLSKSASGKVHMDDEISSLTEEAIWNIDLELILSAILSTAAAQVTLCCSASYARNLMLHLDGVPGPRA